MSPRRTIFVLMAVLAVASCGRKGSPVPPDDADTRAPRIYPVDRTRPATDTPADPSAPPPVGPPAASPPPLFYSR